MRYRQNIDAILHCNVEDQMVSEALNRPSANGGKSGILEIAHATSAWVRE